MMPVIEYGDRRDYGDCHNSCQEGKTMPMIDVYASEGIFLDKHTLARDVAAAVMRWEKVPEIDLFRKNTAAFVHEMPSDCISNVSGDSQYVRLQVLTRG